MVNVQEKSERICIGCGNKKLVSKAMIYAIIKGYTTGRCQSCASKGNKARLGSIVSPTTRRKMSLAALGKPKTLEHRLNMSKARRGMPQPNNRGEKHYLWIKDRTKVKQYWTERNNPEYKQWRKSVLKRDDWRCRACGERDCVKTQADHIYGWTRFPRLRYMIENGQALCRGCHKTKTAMEMRGIQTVSIY